MAVAGHIPPTAMNPNSFLAKLWRLVNDPHYSSMQWDSHGEGIIIDQALFEAELLVSPREVDVPHDTFKMSSFGSFIRQLKLYGFRRSAYGSDGSWQPGGNPRAGNRSPQRFCNSFFRREHPELLINIKRLTNIDKGKMAPGGKVQNRPPNRYQRLFPNTLEEQRKAENQGLAPVEKMHRFSKHENISLNPYAGPGSQSHSLSSINEFGDISMSTRMWPSSLGPYQGHLTVPSSFPFMQQYPADVGYALQSTATSLHFQQSHSVMMESVHNNRMLPTVQYPNVYYPTGGFQCYPPTCMEYVSNVYNPAVLLYQHYNYYQNPQMQTPFFMQFFHPQLPQTNYDYTSGNQVNFSTAVQVVDDLQASSQLQMTNPDIQGNHKEPLSSTNFGQLPETLDHSQTNQVECLLPVNMDTTQAAGLYHTAPLLQTQTMDAQYTSNSNTEISPT